MMGDEPITEDWLRDCGFRWHQFDRQPNKQWLLWVGGIGRRMFGSSSDLGIEIAFNRDGEWFCWLRADLCGRYTRFLHIRHVRTQGEVTQLFEAITGQPWDIGNHLYGMAHTPERAAWFRKESERLEVRIGVEQAKSAERAMKLPNAADDSFDRKLVNDQ